MRPVGDKDNESTSLDQKCDEYTLHLTELDPLLAIEWGIGETGGKFPDFSPEGLEQAASADQEMLTYVRSRTDWQGHDAVTAAALEDRLTLSLDLHSTGEDLRDLNNIASPLQSIRDCFELMPRHTTADWSQISVQSAAVGGALAGYRESLALAATQGNVAARRQVEAAITQASKAASYENGTTFRDLAEEAPTNTPGIAEATRDAANAYGEMAQWLRQELLPLAPETDAVGRERYELFSALFVGARVDLEETYQWGLDELRRIDAKQREIAAQLYGPGTTTLEALTKLNAEPRYTIRGTRALKQWMQDLGDSVIRDLNGTEFDIPKKLHIIQAVVTSGDGGIYYTPPTADFSRPGRMCWSVPENEDTFHTWQERTTVFHEGVPGHHLQIGQAMASSDQLNLWRRLASWNSGHGEGWALYAEGLMAELGYQDDPGNMMGLLDAERLRAARVALDIGVHLQLKRPDGTGTWDADYAWHFLKENVAMADGFLRFELDRYLGWPGQAPSYKVGARLWAELREQYAAKHPELSKPLARRQFHDRALALGSLPMSALNQAVLS